MWLQPADLSYEVSLTFSEPSPLLDISLSSPTISSSEVVTLTITDQHSGQAIVPALKYTVPITASATGLTQMTDIILYVGGVRVFLPTIPLVYH